MSYNDWFKRETEWMEEVFAPLRTRGDFERYHAYKIWHAEFPQDTPEECEAVYLRARSRRHSYS